MQTRFKLFLVSIALVATFVLGGDALHAQSKVETGCVTPTSGQCGDGIDNDGDGTADRCGVYESNGSYIPPDPACVPTDATVETPEKPSQSRLIPCTDKCNFSDLFEMLNNVINFFFTVVLIPIVFIVLLYTGFKYIKAQGNPGMLATLGNTFKHLVLGIVIILCAWLIVRTILVGVISGNFGDVLMFFQ